MRDDMLLLHAFVVYFLFTANKSFLIALALRCPGKAKIVKIGGPWTRSMIRGSMDPVHERRSMDPVHGPGPSKYGPGPWTPFMDRVHGPPI